MSSEPRCYSLELKNTKEKLKLTNLSIEVVITGFLAKTAVTMTFFNETDHDGVEGELVFPMAEGSVLAGYAIDINGELVEGVVVEKEKARQVFETEARKEVSHKPTASIAEHVVGNVFKTRVFPIPKRAARSIRVSTVEELDAQNTFWLLLDFAGKTIENYHFSVQVDSHGSIPPKIWDGTDATPRAGRIMSTLELAKSDKDTSKARSSSSSSDTKDLGRTRYRERFTSSNSISPKGCIVYLPPSSDLVIVEPNETNTEYYFVIGGQFASFASAKPPAGADFDVTCNRVGIVWDTSSSRQTHDKKVDIEIVKLLVQKLGKSAKLDIIPFSDAMGTPVTLTMTGITSTDNNAIERHLNALTYDGGTNLSGLKLTKGPTFEHTTDTYAYYCLFTDGMHNMSTKAVPEVLEAPVYIFASSAESNTSLLKIVARKSGGEYFKFTTSTATPQLKQAVDGLGAPVFSFLGFNVDSNFVREVYPSIPTRVDNVFRLSGKISLESSSAGDSGASASSSSSSGSSSSIAKAFQGTFVTLNFGFGSKVVHSVTFQIGITGAAFTSLIPRFWAQKKIDELTLFPEEKENEKLILDLGRKFSIVTPTTSIIVLEELDQYLKHDIEPPAALHSIRTKWLAIMQERALEAKAKTEEKIVSVLTLWNRRTAWWNEDLASSEAGEKNHMHFMPFGEGVDLVSRTLASQWIDWDQAHAPPPGDSDSDYDSYDDDDDDDEDYSDSDSLGSGSGSSSLSESEGYSSRASSPSSSASSLASSSEEEAAVPSPRNMLQKRKKKKSNESSEPPIWRADESGTKRGRSIGSAAPKPATDDLKDQLVQRLKDGLYGTTTTKAASIMETTRDTLATGQSVLAQLSSQRERLHSSSRSLASVDKRRRESSKADSANYDLELLLHDMEESKLIGSTEAEEILLEKAPRTWGLKKDSVKEERKAKEYVEDKKMKKEKDKDDGPMKARKKMAAPLSSKGKGASASVFAEDLLDDLMGADLFGSVATTSSSFAAEAAATATSDADDLDSLLLNLALKESRNASLPVSKPSILPPPKPAMASSLSKKLSSSPAPTQAPAAPAPAKTVAGRTFSRSSSISASAMPPPPPPGLAYGGLPPPPPPTLGGAPPPPPPSSAPSASGPPPPPMFFGMMPPPMPGAAPPQQFQMMPPSSFSSAGPIGYAAPQQQQLPQLQQQQQAYNMPMMPAMPVPVSTPSMAPPPPRPSARVSSVASSSASNGSLLSSIRQGQSLRASPAPPPPAKAAPPPSINQISGLLARRIAVADDEEDEDEDMDWEDGDNDDFLPVPAAERMMMKEEREVQAISIEMAMDFAADEAPCELMEEGEADEHVDTAYGRLFGDIGEAEYSRKDDDSKDLRMRKSSPPSSPRFSRSISPPPKAPKDAAPEKSKQSKSVAFVNGLVSKSFGADSKPSPSTGSDRSAIPANRSSSIINTSSLSEIKSGFESSRGGAIASRRGAAASRGGPTGTSISRGPVAAAPAPSAEGGGGTRNGGFGAIGRRGGRGAGPGAIGFSHSSFQAQQQIQQQVQLVPHQPQQLPVPSQKQSIPDDLAMSFFSSSMIQQPRQSLGQPRQSTLPSTRPQATTTTARPVSTGKSSPTSRIGRMPVSTTSYSSSYSTTSFLDTNETTTESSVEQIGLETNYNEYPEPEPTKPSEHEIRQRMRTEEIDREIARVEAESMARRGKKTTLQIAEPYKPSNAEQWDSLGTNTLVPYRAPIVKLEYAFYQEIDPSAPKVYSKDLTPPPEFPDVDWDSMVYGNSTAAQSWKKWRQRHREQTWSEYEAKAFGSGECFMDIFNRNRRLILQSRIQADFEAVEAENRKNRALKSNKKVHERFRVKLAPETVASEESWQLELELHTSPSSAYSQYMSMRQRPELAKLTKFYMDAADYFFERLGDSAKAATILSNLAELELENPQFLRLIAFRLERAPVDPYLQVAINVYRKILAIRSEEPQSHRDLAMALTRRALHLVRTLEEKRNNPDVSSWNSSTGTTGASIGKSAKKAMMLMSRPAYDRYALQEERKVQAEIRSLLEESIKLLNDVVLRKWDVRFTQVEVVALMDLNRVVSIVRSLNLEHVIGLSNLVDPRVISLQMPVDVRIQIQWDTDMTDVELTVVEPSGEKCNSIHNKTGSGGMMSRDFTHGYGPVEYLSRFAGNGHYTASIKLFHALEMKSGTTVLVRVWTDYGRPDLEKEHFFIGRLNKAKQTLSVCDISVNNGVVITKV